MLIYQFGSGTLRNVVLSDARSELRAEELACTTDERGRQATTSNNQTTETLPWIQAQGRFRDNCVCVQGKRKKTQRIIFLPSINLFE